MVSTILGLSLFLLTSFAVSVAADQASPLLHVSGAPSFVPAVALATGPWYIDRIDRPVPGPGADRGKYASIAIRSTQTYISYYDPTDTSLRLAYNKSGGGNCGPGNTWWCEVIDNNGDVGQWNSIATTPGGKTLFGIAYYDATSRALKFATYSCAFGPCTSSAQTILTPTLGSAFVGQYTSAKYDANGAAHIAFFGGGLVGALGYARSVPSGSGNCGVGAAAGRWQCDGIDRGAGIGESVGQWASLDLTTSNQPRIAYYDATNKQLKYATFVGNGTGNCGLVAAAGNWQCDTIDDVGDVGQFASLRIAKNSSGNPFIAYYDATNGKLKVATKTGTGGNCGPLSGSTRTWQCLTIADMGLGLTQAGLALELIGADEPVVSYMQAGGPTIPSKLNLASATRVMAGGSYNHNCGPYPSMFAWWCETLDSGSSSRKEASYLSMAADYSGRLSIAYYESDSSFGTGYLKLAHQGLQLFLPLIRR